MSKEELRWKKYQVLDDGFICLVDWMGDDSSIVQAARVSYGEGTKKLSDDRGLIRYLMRHAHWTPVEMAEVKFLLRLPMDANRQLVRHRTFSLNEYSTRYSLAIDSAQTTDPTKWRSQATNNKQGSGDYLTEWPSEEEFKRGRICSSITPEGHIGDYLSMKEAELQNISRALYMDRISLGVAREQARKDLPLSTYTELYLKSNLRNIFNFLSLRMDSHAQLEIRLYANAMYEIVKQLYPLAVEAFDDYDMRRGAMALSALDIKVIHQLKGFSIPANRDQFLNAVAWADVSWPGINDPDKKHREQEECWDKLLRMNLVKEEHNEQHS